MVAPQGMTDRAGYATPVWWLAPRAEAASDTILATETAPEPPTRTTSVPLASMMYSTFMDMVAAIPDVRKVYAEIDTDTDIVSVWTIVDTEDREQEYRVLRAYGDIFRTFGNVSFYHLMINARDYSHDEYRHMIPPTAQVVLSR